MKRHASPITPFLSCVYSLPITPPPLLLSSHPDARKYTLQVIPVLTGLRSPMNNTDPISSVHYSRLTVHLAGYKWRICI